MKISVRICDGESLRAICADAGMPDRATIFRWLARHDEFRVWYSVAREEQIWELQREAIEIADEVSLDRASIKLASLRINARMRQAGRMASKKYGRS
jgi:hypothetical protein